jgi:hypothetical protein
MKGGLGDQFSGLGSALGTALERFIFYVLHHFHDAAFYAFIFINRHFDSTSGFAGSSYFNHLF